MLFQERCLKCPFPTLLKIFLAFNLKLILLFLDSLSYLIWLEHSLFHTVHYTFIYDWSCFKVTIC